MFYNSKIFENALYWRDYACLLDILQKEKIITPEAYQRLTHTCQTSPFPLDSIMLYIDYHPTTDTQTCTRVSQLIAKELLRKPSETQHHFTVAQMTLYSSQNADLLTAAEYDHLSTTIQTQDHPLLSLLSVLITQITPATQARWIQVLQNCISLKPRFKELDYAWLFNLIETVPGIDHAAILAALNCPVKTHTPIQVLLETAIQTNHIAIVKRLLHLPELDINHQNPQGETPLHTAVYGKKMEMVTLLLAQQNVKLTLTDQLGLTVLDGAVIANNVACIALFKQFYPHLAEMEAGQRAKKIANDYGYKTIVALLTPMSAPATLSRQNPPLRFATLTGQSAALATPLLINEAPKLDQI